MTDAKIPKIIHQLWIGSKPPPTKMMDTWKDMNPDFEYIRWNEELIAEKGIKFECKKRIREMTEINGQADIMRWEILYKYGGIFIDADSYCIKPIDDVLLNTKAFAGYEQEEIRKGLIATGTMGFPVNHILCRKAIDYILVNEVNVMKCRLMAWQTVGPGLLTKLYNEGYGKDMTIFPSYYFLPVHCTGKVYNGHGKVYAYQEWGSTKQSYDKMHKVEVPEFLHEPEHSVSMLISSYNTKAIYVKECLESIKRQLGRVNIEIVWINDGSNPMNTVILKKTLEKFEKETRWIKVIYSENDGNKGIGYTLNKGIQMCTRDIIIKMDSDDIMVDDRVAKQYQLMMQNPQLMICGAQVEMFDDQGNKRGQTNHQSLTWDMYKNNVSHWFMNHPTACYRKAAVLTAGNYNPNLSRMSEDFELELRMLKCFGYVHNMPDVLLKYRLHDKQVTFNGGSEGRVYWNEKRNEIIKNLISDHKDVST